MKVLFKLLLILVAPLILGRPNAGHAQALPHDAAASKVPAASRILSVGGDITEIIYALGAGDRLVAVDATSQFPPAALKTKRNVGYMRALSTEGVLSVGATLVIASDRAGPPEVVKALKSAVAYIEIPEGTSAEGVPVKIEAVARALGIDEPGAKLALSVREELVAVGRKRQAITRPLKALFVLNVQSGRVTVGGASTSSDAIFRLAGLENAARAITGYKPVSDEALLGMQPEVIVVMKRTAGDHDGAQAIALPALSRSPAVRNHHIVVMDGLLLLGFGPRVAEAAQQLMLSAYRGASGVASK